MATETAHTFHHVPSRKFPSLTSTDAVSSLMKWSMKGRLHCQCYAFDETFKPHNVEKFVMAFFNEKNIRHTIETEVLLPDVIESVEVTPVPCSLLTLDIFNRLTGTVARENGIIKSCLDDTFESILISDELRKMLLIEDSENYCLFTEQERDEFLFRLFKHICIGGELCQFENEMNPYLDFVRSLYRDLVSVQKDQASKELRVVSHVYSLKIKSNNEVLFPAPEEHPNNFAYFVINPNRRHAVLISHVFGIGQF